MIRHWRRFEGVCRIFNRDFDRFDIRHEIEVGVTDHFQLGLYLSDWRYEENRPKGVHRGDWRGVALEGIWNLTNPTTDPVGLALYAEVKIGDKLLELEGKLIAQKNIGPRTVVGEGPTEGPAIEIL